MGPEDLRCGVGELASPPIGGRGLIRRRQRYTRCPLLRGQASKHTQQQERKSRSARDPA